jgi:hypothetical protein
MTSIFNHINILYNLEHEYEAAYAAHDYMIEFGLADINIVNYNWWLIGDSSGCNVLRLDSSLSSCGLQTHCIGNINLAVNNRGSLNGQVYSRAKH